MSEFTTKVRNFVKMYENEVPRRAEITFLEEACTRLVAYKVVVNGLEECISERRKENQRAKSINKDLLEASEYACTLILRNIGQSTHAVALLESAIAKAKKEGA